MGNASDRDRQPSARYVERLADRLAPLILLELELNEPGHTDAALFRMRRQLTWLVIDTAKAMRAENDDRD